MTALMYVSCYENSVSRRSYYNVFRCIRFRIRHYFGGIRWGSGHYYFKRHYNYYKRFKHNFTTTKRYIGAL